MKTRTLSVALMSLVSALTLLSLATAQQSRAAGGCDCGVGYTCVGGQCLGKSLVPPPDFEKKLDIKGCTTYRNTVTCDLPTNRITMPKKAFKSLITNH